MADRDTPPMRHVAGYQRSQWWTSRCRTAIHIRALCGAHTQQNQYLLAITTLNHLQASEITRNTPF
jgi:hypothetical protein